MTDSKTDNQTLVIITSLLVSLFTILIRELIAWSVRKRQLILKNKKFNRFFFSWINHIKTAINEQLISIKELEDSFENFSQLPLISFNPPTFITPLHIERIFSIPNDDIFLQLILNTKSDKKNPEKKLETFHGLIDTLTRLNSVHGMLIEDIKKGKESFFNLRTKFDEKERRLNKLGLSEERESQLIVETNKPTDEQDPFVRSMNGRFFELNTFHPNQAPEHIRSFWSEYLPWVRNFILKNPDNIYAPTVLVILEDYLRLLDEMISENLHLAQHLNNRRRELELSKNKVEEYGNALKSYKRRCFIWIQ